MIRTKVLYWNIYTALLRSKNGYVKRSFGAVEIFNEIELKYEQ
jgi:hypothetical protein